MSNYVAPYLKAHIAGLGAGVTLLVADTNGNLQNLGNLTGSQWLDALAATGLLGGLVGIVANRPAPAAPSAMFSAVSQDSGDAPAPADAPADAPAAPAA